MKGNSGNPAARMIAFLESLSTQHHMTVNHCATTPRIDSPCLLFDIFAYK